MTDIHLSNEEIRELENMLTSTSFAKLMEVAAYDYQVGWAAAQKTEDRERIWHLMHATQHVHQRLADLVAGIKLRQKAQEARLRPSDAELLRPNGLAPNVFEE